MHYTRLNFYGRTKKEYFYSKSVVHVTLFINRSFSPLLRHFSTSYLSFILIKASETVLPSISHALTGLRQLFHNNGCVAR